MAYKHRSYWIDDFNLKGMLAHNEPLMTIKKMLVEFKFSDHCKTESGYEFNLIEFAKHFILKGFDWKLIGKPEWEKMKPQKRKAFIKPRLKQEKKFPTPFELVTQVRAKHAKPDTMYSILDEMARTIALVPDQLRREVHILDLANSFNFNYEVLKKQVEIKRKQQKQQHEYISKL